MNHYSIGVLAIWSILQEANNVITSSHPGKATRFLWLVGFLHHYVSGFSFTPRCTTYYWVAEVELTRAGLGKEPAFLRWLNAIRSSLPAGVCVCVCGCGERAKLPVHRKQDKTASIYVLTRSSAWWKLLGCVSPPAVLLFNELSTTHRPLKEPLETGSPLRHCG